MSALLPIQNFHDNHNTHFPWFHWCIWLSNGCSQASLTSRSRKTAGGRCQDGPSLGTTPVATSCVCGPRIAKNVTFAASLAGRRGLYVHWSVCRDWRNTNRLWRSRRKLCIYKWMGLIRAKNLFHEFPERSCNCRRYYPDWWRRHSRSRYPARRFSLPAVLNCWCVEEECLGTCSRIRMWDTGDALLWCGAHYCAQKTQGVPARKCQESALAWQRANLWRNHEDITGWTWIRRPLQNHWWRPFCPSAQGKNHHCRFQRTSGIWLEHFEPPSKRPANT